MCFRSEEGAILLFDLEDISSLSCFPFASIIWSSTYVYFLFFSWCLRDSLICFTMRSMLYFQILSYRVFPFIYRILSYFLSLLLSASQSVHLHAVPPDPSSIRRNVSSPKKFSILLTSLLCWFFSFPFVYSSFTILCMPFPHSLAWAASLWCVTNRRVFGEDTLNWDTLGASFGEFRRTTLLNICFSYSKEFQVFICLFRRLSVF